MLPLMACTCASRAVEPIPHIRITRKKTLLARIVMAAPGTKTFNDERNTKYSNVRGGCWCVLTGSRNRSGKAKLLKNKTEGTEKRVLSNVLPGCFTFVKTVARQSQILRDLIAV